MKNGLIISKSGDKHWYVNDILHREDGPAVEFTNGTKYWYIDGKIHRKGGPAIEWECGSCCWFIDGKFHREDGPAIEYSNGDTCWYISGEEISRSTIDIIFSIAGKENLLEYLLDDNLAVRFFANKRLKMLEKEII